MLHFRVSTLIFGVLLAGCGVLPQEVTPTPRVAAPAETPVVIATPISPPSVTGLKEATPTNIAPIAAASAGARTDCPADFATFRDVASTFSLCAPGSLEARGGIDNSGGPLINLATPRGSGAPDVFVSVQATSRATFPDPSRVAKLCASGLVQGQTSDEEIRVSVAGLSAIGCHVVGEPNAVNGPLEMISLTAPIQATKEPRYLNVLFTWRTQSAGAKALLDAILATVALGP